MSATSARRRSQHHTRADPSAARTSGITYESDVANIGPVVVEEEEDEDEEEEEEEEGKERWRREEAAAAAAAAAERRFSASCNSRAKSSSASV